MKHGTHGHVKMRRLARLLGVPRMQAVGIMVTIWDTVPDCCLAGNLGALSDDEIADVVDWPGDPAALVKALCDSGFVDRDSRHRLVIHDWDEHAQAWVKKRAVDRSVTLLHRGDQVEIKTGESTNPNKVDHELQQSLPSTPTKLALPPLSSPLLPSPPLPPAGGGSGSADRAERDAARKILVAEPWPAIGPRKATELAASYPPGLILAAVKRGREANERGMRVGGGLVVNWIESGDMAEIIAERSRATAAQRRAKARQWWDMASEKDRADACGAFARTGGVLPAGKVLAPGDDLLDFCAANLWPQKVRLATA